MVSACLLYVLTTSKVISGRILTCDSVLICDSDFIVLLHWETRLPAPRADTRPSHIILTLELTSSWPKPKMWSTWLGSDKYKYFSHCFDREVLISRSLKTGDWRSTHSAILSGQYGNCSGFNNVNGFTHGSWAAGADEMINYFCVIQLLQSVKEEEIGGGERSNEAVALQHFSKVPAFWA